MTDTRFEELKTYQIVEKSKLLTKLIDVEIELYQLKIERLKEIKRMMERL